MAWLTLVMPSEAAKVSHKVHSIISSMDEFSSARSEVLLISVRGVNENLGGFPGSLIFTLGYIQDVFCFCYGGRKAVNASLCRICC